MVSLKQLKLYAEKNNCNELITIDKYIQSSTESWTNGKYYYGGQIPLDLNTDITCDHFVQVEEKNKNAGGPFNSWESASIYIAEKELTDMKSIIDKYYRKARYNGLLRSIVFWLSPARKRATEKVFHPSKMTKYFSEIEIEFHKNIRRSFT